MANTPTQRVAIVGAGAMGIMTGYHLSRAPIEIDLLVRPARAAKIPAAYRLYSYDDGVTREFGQFGVLSDPDDLSKKDYAFVILALDGASLASDEGRTLLEKIGKAVQRHDTVLIVGSIGIGLRELAITSSGLPEQRVLSGRLALLCHATSGVSLPLHAPTEPAQLAQADFAMRHHNDGCFVIENRNEAVGKFAELFAQSGIAKCLVVPPEQFALNSRAMFPLFALSEMLGWPSADVLTQDPDLWSLTVDAVRAIQGLKEHGEAGRTAAAELTGDNLIGMWRHIEKASLPLDWQAFNAYQHGDRVKVADKLLLEGCIARGMDEGRDMSSVRRILDLWN
ncbi:hypothetical protein RSP795_23000 [Ralstonia solanacearum]|uniref:ketopantoate reductase family protein n=1 Tax=Ralstonia solanacearum TaxID=305 RepID=UPI0007D7869C|nr:2-dehydropantoate 2-reductase N-terminal domain-containing protein [Ralstonia solanacearum]OAI58717.1 hypothetical protein RSP795_23000 [Ralstonia solanacearum]